LIEAIGTGQMDHDSLTRIGYRYLLGLFYFKGAPHMTTMLSKVVIVIVLLACSLSARADDLRAAMEAANAQWLRAFNTPNPAAFPDLYTSDAVLLFQGAPSVKGAEAIGQFWAARIKLGLRDHGFEILDTWADGKYAYQWARASAVLVKPTGERITVGGNTVRIFEKQGDGTWKTRIHMFNRPD
jgi:ketosteroid isomerase-like protein